MHEQFRQQRILISSELTTLAHIVSLLHPPQVPTLTFFSGGDLHSSPFKTDMQACIWLLSSFEGLPLIQPL